ncbi:MAG: NAD-dependent epimerase/dehydratase family protein [Saprospiraceae bacterium]|nr:NAD-dependent epimerase/dehydratase family protein [Saprospiraceae bacterium]
MKKIFLTGGTGLLGRSIISRITEEDNYEIIGLKRATSQLEGISEKVTWMEGDLLDQAFIEAQVQQADLVIHCAAVVDFRPSRRKEILKTNVTSTAQIVDACVEHNKRLIHISSVAALGYPEKGKEVTENTDFQPDALNTDYAYSKYYSEMEVWRGFAEGLNGVVLNPSIIIGKPAKWSDSTGSFWVSARKGLPFYTTGTTGFVDARDISDVVAGLLDSEITGERFIMNSENWSYRAFNNLVASSINAKPPKIKVTSLLGGLMWRTGWLIQKVFRYQIPYTKALHQVASTTAHFSSEKAQRQLGARFRPVEESIHWLSEQFLADEQ